MTEQRTETFHGVEIGAERDERVWRPLVDGDYYGSQTFLSSRDALTRARRAVERRLGLREERTPFTIDPDAPEPEWARELRAAISAP